MLFSGTFRKLLFKYIKDQRVAKKQNKNSDELYVVYTISSVVPLLTTYSAR